jgi:hypothetical protein
MFQKKINTPPGINYKDKKAERIVGIDVGLTGAITIGSRNGKIVHTKKLPLITWDNDKEMLDVFAFCRFFWSSKRYTKVLVERCFSFPGRSATGSFQFGGMYYVVLSCLRLMKIPYKVVEAKEWQNYYFSHLSTEERNLDTKKKAELVIQQKFPEHYEAVCKKQKSGKLKYEDGMGDSYLIYRYAQMLRNHEIAQSIMARNSIRKKIL